MNPLDLSALNLSIPINLSKLDLARLTRARDSLTAQVYYYFDWCYFNPGFSESMIADIHGYLERLRQVEAEIAARAGDSQC